MPAIILKNVTFSHDGAEPIFDNVSLNLDTSWRLGLIGRNGKGKTTLLKLMLGEYDYDGQIKTTVKLTYFPCKIPDQTMTTRQLFNSQYGSHDQWKLEIEATQLGLDINKLDAPFGTLSYGEQTKAQLALLFIHDERFALIDEPTNHLDLAAQKIVAQYLRAKSGFILVSHNRQLLDASVDHILAINRNQIALEHGNFSSWFENKKRQDDYEQTQDAKLKRQITKLNQQISQKTTWAKRIEASKYHPVERGFFDRGFIGARSAKMAKGAIVAKRHKLRAINEKSALMKNVEPAPILKLAPINNPSGRLVDAMNLSFSIGSRQILQGINFYVNSGDRVRIAGVNGSGKTTLLRILLGKQSGYNGKLVMPSHLKVSYLPQDTSSVHGLLSDFIANNELDTRLFLALLDHLGFNHAHFNVHLETLSTGQKRKILIAKSLSERANIYIWDEPLNFIDIFTRLQLEQLICQVKPTMIFVEHDDYFGKAIATKTIHLC